MLVKRTQAERLMIVESLVSKLWDELKDNNSEEDILQLAVNVQVFVNRIVWKLNKQMQEEVKTDERFKTMSV